MTMNLQGALRAILMCAFLSTGVNGYAADAPLTPAQAAYVKVEARKLDDKFIAQVAQATGLRHADVAKDIPDQHRIADPVARLIERLERRLGKPMSEAQKVQIQQAEKDRAAAYAAVEAAARTK